MAEIEDTYRVLLVSSSDRFNDALAQLMPDSIYSQVAVARSVSAAKRLLMEQDFDLVLVNGPLPDDLGMRFARDAAAGTSAGVVLPCSPNQPPRARLSWRYSSPAPRIGA